MSLFMSVQPTSSGCPTQSALRGWMAALQATEGVLTLYTLHDVVCCLDIPFQLSMMMRLHNPAPLGLQLTQGSQMICRFDPLGLSKPGEFLQVNHLAGFHHLLEWWC